MTDVARTAVLAVLLGLVTSAPAHAQVTVGVSAGLNLSRFNSDDFDGELDTRTGLLLGGSASTSLSERLSLAAGLRYVQKGARRFNAADLTFEIDYLELPLVLAATVYELGPAELSVFAGPSLAFELDCQLVDEDSEVETRPVGCDSRIFGDTGMETQRVTLGGVIGATTRWWSWERTFVLVKGGFDLGLTSIDRGDEDGLKNRSWFLQAGIGWILGG